MERAKLTSKIRLAVALAGVLGAGSLAFAATTPAAVAATSPNLGSATPADKCVPNPNPICYQIYSPVICSNGVVYTNQCYADAACATGCKPYSG